LPRPANRDVMDELMKKAMKAHTPEEANAIIDELGKFGEDAVYALEDVVNQTKFDQVRAHGLEVIRDIKFEDTQF
jgi:hypothetical protein